MLVPGRIYATEKILKQIEPGALEQISNVSYLPGIQKYSIAMPEAHYGYGFVIGGIAGIDHENGVVSPGGVGFDISCGIRLVKTNLTEKDVKPKMNELFDGLFGSVPAGLGGKSKFKVSNAELAEAVEQGSKWVIEKGYGWGRDAEFTEEDGCMQGADAGKVSQKAMQRGMPQFGTLGSGNHFLELQKVDEIFDEDIAKVYGLEKGQVVVMVHCGSRGFGHQVASDYLNTMLGAMQKYNIKVPDRQLCSAPITSREGQDYLAAMKCAVNYAFCNRQVIMHWVRDVFAQVFKQDAEALGMDLVYDICHNVAKEETHSVNGKKMKLLVHRKGATRAMPAGRPENPKAYAETGHPALIPGDMGSPSYVCVGTEKGLEETFGSVAHGAGRVMSRHQAMRTKSGEQVKRELEAKGQVVRTASLKGLAEEASFAYKEIDDVVESVVKSGIGRKVTMQVPLGVVKG